LSKAFDTQRHVDLEYEAHADRIKTPSKELGGLPTETTGSFHQKASAPGVFPSGVLKDTIDPWTCL
jgi:hypothetical protein